MTCTANNPILKDLGTFLTCQWLRLCAVNAGGVGLIPAWGTKILHAMWCGPKIKKKKKKSECLESPCLLPLYQAVTNHIKLITYWISTEVLNILPLCFYIILTLLISIGLILQMRSLWVTELNQLVQCSKTSKRHRRFRLDSISTIPFSSNM